MPRALSRLVILAVCLIPQGVVGSGPGPMVLAVDAAASQILIEVGKTGMLGFAGHAHEVAAADVHGRITFDPADLQHAGIRLECPAAALRVTGTDEPPAEVAAANPRSCAWPQAWPPARLSCSRSPPLQPPRW